MPPRKGPSPLLEFVHNRMCVGFSKENWHRVWYDPIGDPDEDGGAEFGLYRYPTGEPGKREPMKGTVMWHPFFNPETLESTDRKEKKEIQKQLLYDTWVIIGAGSLEELEETLRSMMDFYPGDRKRAVYAEAEKAARERLGRRRQRAGRREANRARVEGRAGKGKGRAHDGESGYGGSDSDMSVSDEEGRNELQQMRQTAFERHIMPPPRRPAKGKVAASKSRARAASSAATSRSSSVEFTMSGANGVRESTESEQGFEREPIGGSPSRASPRRSPGGVRSLRSASAGDAKRSLEEGAELPPRTKTPRLGPSILREPAAGHLPTPASQREQMQEADEAGNNKNLDNGEDEYGFSNSDIRRALRASQEPGGS